MQTSKSVQRLKDAHELRVQMDKYLPMFIWNEPSRSWRFISNGKGYDYYIPSGKLFCGGRSVRMTPAEVRQSLILDGIITEKDLEPKD